jgi:PadR family transcriptional regulator PadR
MLTQALPHSLIDWYGTTEGQWFHDVAAFLENPGEELSGADVNKRGRIASGTLYPILLRLEFARWFVSGWEAIDRARVGRIRRRL